MLDPRNYQEFKQKLKLELLQMNKNRVSSNPRITKEMIKLGENIAVESMKVVLSNCLMESTLPEQWELPSYESTSQSKQIINND